MLFLKFQLTYHGRHCLISKLFVLKLMPKYENFQTYTRNCISLGNITLKKYKNN